MWVAVAVRVVCVGGLERLGSGRFVGVFRCVSGRGGFRNVLVLGGIIGLVVLIVLVIFVIRILKS